METSVGIGQQLLLVAEVFLSVTLCAFALVALAGLLAHAQRRKTLRRARAQQTLCDKEKSVINPADYEK